MPPSPPVALLAYCNSTMAATKVAPYKATASHCVALRSDLHFPCGELLQEFFVIICAVSSASLLIEVRVQIKCACQDSVKRCGIINVYIPSKPL